MDRRADRTVTYGPGDYNAKLKIPLDFPNRDTFSPLQHCSWGNGGPFQYLLDYCGTRYNFLLEFNKSASNCQENRLLQKLYEGISTRDYGIMDVAARDCLELFLQFLRSSYESGQDHPISLPKLEAIRVKQVVQIKILTENGALRATEHTKELEYEYECGKPIQNPFPHLRVLKDSEVERLQELSRGLFKVKIDGKECFLKAAYHTDPDSFLREFTLLSKIPPHSNVVPLFGVTDAGEGKIDGIVMPFIHGTELGKLKSVTGSQKTKWKKQISDAVSFLHSVDVIWGDAAAQNIMIDESGDNAILYDFGGGITSRWVDSNLYETKEGDLQGLGRLLEYIDNLDLEP